MTALLWSAKSEMTIKQGQIVVCATTQPANRPGYLYARSGEKDGYIPEEYVELIDFDLK